MRPLLLLALTFHFSPLLGHLHHGVPNQEHGSENYLTAGVHHWIPAALIANASRSPCPMLNTFANHAFLPRDGRNITRDDFNNAMVDSLNFDFSLANKTTTAMVAKLGAGKNTSTAFDLEEFSAHDFTEHDASLTRLDYVQGAFPTVVELVNPGLVKLLLDDSNTSYLDTQSIGKTRARREYESVLIGSPPLPERFVSFAQLESSFIPLVFGINASGGDVCDRRAPKRQVREWLNEERFPVDHGFQKPSEVLTASLQTALISSIKTYHDLYIKFEGIPVIFEVLAGILEKESS